MPPLAMHATTSRACTVRLLPNTATTNPTNALSLQISWRTVLAPVWAVALLDTPGMSAGRLVLRVRNTGKRALEMYPLGFYLQVK